MDADLRRLCTRIAAAAGIGSVPLLLASYASDETVELCLESPPDACPSAIDALPLLYVENGTDPACSPSAVIGEAIPEQVALGNCCYEVVETCNSVMSVGCGRPLSIGGTAKIAVQRAALTAQPQAERRTGANSGASLTAALTSAQRDQLASFWTDIALAEHASIAEFHRVSLELLRFGAPEALIAAAQRAAMDEARHARRAFDLASSYAGERLSAGAMQLPVAMPLAATLVELARNTVQGGCIAETQSAALCMRLVRRATDAKVKSVLEGIVRDELRHAELAWAIVRWAMEAGGAAVHEAVANELGARPSPTTPDGALVGTPADPMLAAHGWIAPEDEQAVNYECWRAVVRPVGQALLRDAA